MTATCVVLDATVLGDTGGRRGIGTFARGLLGALGARSDLEVRALVAPGEELPEGVRPIAVRRSFPERFRHYERDLRLPWELRRHRGDVAHGLDAEPPRGAPHPYVQTLFDVIPLVFDDPALRARRRRWVRLAPRFRSAERVVAISAHAAATGIEHLGLDPRRVEVVPLGVDHDRFRADGPVAPRTGREPYVLFVGQLSRRKGLAEALAVYGRLHDGGLPHRLVVAGWIAPWQVDEVERLVAAGTHPDGVEMAGHVDDIAALYRGASATLVTSRYEGFGLPVLESMASGTPVVSFANSALPEVVGDAGALVPDGDIDRFATEVAAILRSPRRHQELREAGLERAREFTWDRCAELHAAIYAELA